MRLLVKKIDESSFLPTYGSCGAAGFDLYSNVDITIPAWSRRIVGTGICVCWTSANRPSSPSEPFSVLNSDLDYYLRLSSRSGLASRHNLDVGAGVIDSDYRGELMVCLINNGNESYNVSRGDRICQGILTRIARPVPECCSVLPLSDRGSSGFGSSGV